LNETSKYRQQTLDKWCYNICCEMHKHRGKCEQIAFSLSMHCIYNSGVVAEEDISGQFPKPVKKFRRNSRLKCAL